MSSKVGYEICPGTEVKWWLHEARYSAFVVCVDVLVEWASRNPAVAQGTIRSGTASREEYFKGTPRVLRLAFLEKISQWSKLV